MVLIFIRLKGVENESRRLPVKTKLRHMDGLGAVTLISAVTCLLLALQWGGHTIPWSSSRIIGLFVGFGCLTIFFGLLQWKLGEKATIPLRILKQRSVLMGCFFIAFLDMTAYTVGLINRKILHQDSMADYFGVCILSFFLLPRRTGGFSHNKRCPIHAVSYTANSGNHCFWCHCHQVRLLCRIPSLFKFFIGFQGQRTNHRYRFPL